MGKQDTYCIPTIELDKAKAILRIAYLLSAVDGVICDKEQAHFRDLMRRLFGVHYADSDIMEYLLDVVNDASDLMSIRAFYSEDDEIVKAFTSKAAAPLSEIMDNRLVTREAFAIWISICFADKDFSQIERMAIKSLQQLANAPSFLKDVNKKGVAITGAGAAVAALAALPVCLVGIPAIAAAAILSKRDSTIGISDSFLSEVEKRIKKIGVTHAKLCAAKDSVARENYQDMYDLEIDSLKLFLASK